MATRLTAKIEEAEQRAGKTAVMADYQPPYRWALFTGAAIFALYAITLAPSTAFWDTSEYIATAHILGIPHPPGNPVFVLLARTWELLLAPFPLSTAAKINLFSAANSAAAAALWFLVAHRILAFFSDEELYRRLGALAATLISATAFTVWNQSVVNEKVYTLSLMTIALITWLIFRWRDNLGRGKDDNVLILIVFLLTLSLGNHLMALLVAPALALFVIWVHPQVLTRWRLYAFAGLAAVLGFSAQLFLPIRAGNNPVIAEASPVCESVAAATVDIVSQGRSNNCPALSSSLRRDQYRKPPLNLNPIHYPREIPRDFELIKWQFIHYGQYFDWQWARDLGGREHFFAGKRAPFTLLFFLLGLIGAWRHFQRDRTSWVYFVTLFATVSLGLIIYLNFKYGYSVPAQASVLGPEPSLVPNSWREVRERDYFYIASFSLWGVWAGIGLAAVWQILTELIAGAKKTLSRDAYVRSSPVLALAFLPLFFNWSHASRAGDYAARDWAYNLLMSVEPYGVVFTNGDNDTFPLWYLQEVEGLRRDVTVIVYSYLATPWYARQLRDLTRPCEGRDPTVDPTVIVCQRPFEAERAIDLYSDQDWPVPTRSILDLNDAQIEGIPDCYPVDRLTGRCLPLDSTLVVPIGKIEGFLERGDGLMRNDLLVLRILQTAAGDRPLYFASTTGTFESFALQPYLVRQGAAFKLVNEQITAGDTIAAIPPQLRFQGNRVLPFWLDVVRTEKLLMNHYIYRDMTSWSFWPDHSTSGIPLQYYQAFSVLGSVYLLQNKPVQAELRFQRAVEFANLALGRPSEPPVVTADTQPDSAPAEPAAPESAIQRD